MKLDMLVAEIGSTTTLVNGFSGMNTGRPKFVGQGMMPTTADRGDVTVGLEAAVEDLRGKLSGEKICWERFYASSSAAGGLRMTVHGLVYDMTVKAAKEAALGAGAVIKMVTSGKLTEDDLQKVAAIDPNLILVAGGVDYGERETSLYNAEKLADLGLKSHVIYAGNVQNIDSVARIFQRRGQKVYVVENVYPKVDILNVEPARSAIKAAFEEHITEAAGMGSIREIVDGTIIPTPGAVMNAAIGLYERIGDLVVFDVGGATTDVHSVTEGSEEIARNMTSPEPFAKRTVEGDLGVYKNLRNILDLSPGEFGPGDEHYLQSPKPIPEGEWERSIVEKLTLSALKTALGRHAGKVRHYFGPSGRKTVYEGKDLTGVKWLIGTGGALTRLQGGAGIIRSACSAPPQNSLYPRNPSGILIDRDYIMASLGVIWGEYRDDAYALMSKSLGL